MGSGQKTRGRGRGGGVRGKRQCVEIKLDVGLDQIPDGPLCPDCGDPMEKTYVEHKSYGDTYQFHWAKAPGYECRHCDVKVISPEGVVISLSTARDELIERGEPVTAKAFEEVIQSNRAFIARRGAAVPRNIISLKH